MTNPAIRVSVLTFGVGAFKDAEDYQQGFSITPSPILYNTLFVRNRENGEQKLNLQMQISLNEVALIDRKDPEVRSMPWKYKNAEVQLSLTGTISNDGEVIVESDLVCNSDVKFDDRELKIIGYKLAAYSTIANLKK